jgi:hypothetical protein
MQLKNAYEKCILNMHNARIVKMHFYPHLKSIFNMHNKQIVYPYSNI